ncbi:UNVERIFIED_CONTAM: hypothetical protein GTU68_055642 [Idotea baltica]|nr:hypothetical protein [Idotea baltica]
MAEGRDDPEIFWVDPERRGILPLDRFHISRSLGRRIRRGGFDVSFDQNFSGVVQGCADRPETWINDEINALYGTLHELGKAHSAEVYQEGCLIGGVYGVAIGGAFFGESMFSYQTDASKLALAYLTHRLFVCGFTLFDTQFLTPHLASLGAYEISRRMYQEQLEKALAVSANFRCENYSATAEGVLQRRTQTS